VASRALAPDKGEPRTVDPASPSTTNQLEDQMTRLTRRHVAAVVASAALIVAGCGDDDDDDAGDASATTASDDTSATTAGDDTTATTAGDDTSATTEAAGDGESKGVIAFSYGNESAGIYPIVAEPAKIQAEARGYEFVEGSANGDCDQQVRDVENFVAQGVDAIVVLPLCGVEPLEPVLEEAAAAGIKLVGYSTEIPNGDAAIVYKNVEGAEALAAEAIRWFNEDFAGDKENFTWALYTYDQCGTACTDRTDPIRAAIAEATGVEPLEAESVDETSGLEAAETFLQQEPDLAMLIGINDAGALGAYQAFQGAIANGRSADTIFVAGMDGQTEALELIADGGGENGIYRASGALILDDLGRAVADLPADLLEGKETSVLELPYEIVTPADAARAREIVETYNQFTS
jgi:ribose transport system substrate-binding protein